MVDSSSRIYTFGVIATVFAVSFVLLLTPASAPAAGRAPLTPLTHGLPGARSGQPYSWKLKAEGGTLPYSCTPQRLHVGTLALTRSCFIRGKAPVVQYMSVTGPFIFRLTDSSKRPKTIEFSPMNFTIRANPVTPTTTTTTVPSNNWYLHWNCQGASDCLANFPTPTGTYAVIYNEADCESAAQVYNGVYAPESPFYCDTSPTV